jgi:hypothetical protein
MAALWKEILALFAPARPSSNPKKNAKALIKAIDEGGLPLNPARVNDIARQLGLEVSTRAPMDETIARIRKALQSTSCN